MDELLQSLTQQPTSFPGLNNETARQSLQMLAHMLQPENDGINKSIELPQSTSKGTKPVSKKGKRNKKPALMTEEVFNKLIATIK